MNIEIYKIEDYWFDFEKFQEHTKNESKIYLSYNDMGRMFMTQICKYRNEYSMKYTFVPRYVTTHINANAILSDAPNYMYTPSSMAPSHDVIATGSLFGMNVMCHYINKYDKYLILSDIEINNVSQCFNNYYRQKKLKRIID